MTALSPPERAVAASLPAACSTLLEHRLGTHDRIDSAVLCTVDGRAFAHADRHSVTGTKPPRIAAIASSLLALSESFVRESMSGNAQYASIVSDSGSIVIVRVPSRGRTHALCVSASAQETFAMALRFALDTAQQVASLMDAQPAGAPTNHY